MNVSDRSISFEGGMDSDLRKRKGDACRIQATDWERDSAETSVVFFFE
jgi:hypothetical protein